MIGTPSGFFKSSRGIYLGDPFSSLLCLCHGVLSRMITKAMLVDCIHGVSVDNLSGISLVISHLLYADDSLVFCEANSIELL